MSTHGTGGYLLSGIKVLKEEGVAGDKAAAERGGGGGGRGGGGRGGRGGGRGRPPKRQRN